MSAYTVSKPIFEINNTEDKNNIYTPIFSGSGKNFISFGSMDASTSPKISGGEFSTYSSTSRSGGFKFGSSTGGSEFDTLPKINTYHDSVE